MPAVVVQDVTFALGTRTLLDGVTVGVERDDRIGVVGRNGGGKSTLLRLIAGELTPQSGRIVPEGNTRIRLLDQQDRYDPAFRTLGELVLGDRAEHEWRSDSRIRGIVTGLLGGLEAQAVAQGWATPLDELSGGQLRRASLAAVLIEDPEVLLLDEPTNHLDLQAINWLAGMLNSRRDKALVVVSHDRWFLDTVTQNTWEVADGALHRYEGGYAAYVLAKAERSRQSAASEEKRQNLLRKELAWLRRGAPARTSKPKFRLDAAAELISNEPPPRDRMQLQRVVTARLGKLVIDLEDATLRPAPGVAPVLVGQTWRLGPGDRVGLLAPNGAGKTTLLRLIAGHDEEAHQSHVVLDTGRLKRGKTVQIGHLAQRLFDLDPEDRVLPWLSRGAEHVTVTDGRELTPAQLLEMFGFTGERPWTRLGELSGGERRRLQLLKMFLAGPNLVLLDEPTNDLDTETLVALEDVLDGWPGTLIVVSHDRYFLERVCDDLYAIHERGLRHLPGGVEDYLELLESRPRVAEVAAPAPTTAATTLSGAELRDLRKEVARLERKMAQLEQRVASVHEELAASASDHERVQVLDVQLRELNSELEACETRWLEAGEAIES